MTKSLLKPQIEHLKLMASVKLSDAEVANAIFDHEYKENYLVGYWQGFLDVLDDFNMMLEGVDIRSKYQ